MLSIDGSFGEAGGQIVRTALALSTISKTPFWVKDIRKNRSQPGLKPQHVTCVKVLEELCNAKPKMAFLGSTEMFYTPNKIVGKTIDVDIGTAGSITLLLQSVLLPSLFADKKTIFNIVGGTDVSHSPSFDFFNNVLLPHIKRFANVEVSLEKRGYYPKGHGSVQVKVNPFVHLSDFQNFEDFRKGLREKVKPISLLEQGELVQVKGVSHASLDLQDAQVAERQAESAKVHLSGLGCPVQIRTEYQNTSSTGSGITLWAQFSRSGFEYPLIIGSDKLGEKGVKSEVVGSGAAKQLVEEVNSGACVDKFLADQIIPFIALVGGGIHSSRLSSHALTNVWTIEHFLGKVFEVDGVNNMVKVDYKNL